MTSTVILLVCLAMIGCFMAGVSPASAQIGESGEQAAWQEARQEFDEVVAHSQACESNSQCVWVETGCLLDCYVAVNRQSAERARRAAETFFATVGMDCMRACAPLAPPMCINKRCSAAPR